MWVTCCAAKNLEVLPLVDLWKNRSVKRNWMSYTFKTRHSSQHTVTCSCWYPSSWREMQWRLSQLQSVSVLPFCIRHQRRQTVSGLSAWIIRVLEKKNLAKDKISINSRNCLQESHEKGKRRLELTMVIVYCERIYEDTREKKKESLLRVIWWAILCYCHLVFFCLDQNTTSFLFN